jgi:hypothetical protein
MSQIASIPAAACITARAGAFVIAPTKALALHPEVKTELRITCGTAWVTLGDGVDHFLTAGQALQAAKGSHVVIEPMRRPGASTEMENVYLDWDPVPLRIPQARVPAPKLRPSAPAPQKLAVGQAWGDLRAAFAAGFFAAARLAGALAGAVRPAALGLAAGLAARARSAHSSASAAQGRMAS